MSEFDSDKNSEWKELYESAYALIYTLKSFYEKDLSKSTKQKSKIFKKFQTILEDDNADVEETISSMVLKLKARKFTSTFT